MDEEDVLLALVHLHLKRIRKRREKTKNSRRNQWILKKREAKRIYHTFVQEMALGDRNCFFNPFHSLYPAGRVIILTYFQTAISQKR